MSERQQSPERMPRTETGLFIYSHPRFAQQALLERRALSFAEEPLFAVCEYPIVHNSEGRRDFLKKLNSLLEGDEAAALDIEHANVVARGELAELTDGMEPGEVRRVSAEEYAEAYRNKYGDVIQGPFIF